jgi:hypothetical protein
MGGMKVTLALDGIKWWAPDTVLMLWRTEKSLAPSGNESRFLGRPARSLSKEYRLLGYAAV